MEIRSVCGLLACVIASPALAQDTGMAAAETHMQAQEWEAAVAGYADVVAADSTHGLAWFRMGMALHALERFADAVPAYERAVALGAQVLSAEFRLARAHARLGNPGQALDHLERAVGMGIATPAVLTGAADLTSLRGEPRFVAVVEQARAASEPCLHNAVNRQFDFWVGDWEVFAGGQPAGTNQVDKILRGCVLLENWTSVTGREGKSFNFFDGNTGEWRQLWIADGATVIDYHRGGMHEGNMRFFGTSLGAGGQTVEHRLTFYPIAADSVRQHWESSVDGGSTWITSFDGLYVRRRGTTP